MLFNCRYCSIVCHFCSRQPVYKRERNPKRGIISSFKWLSDIISRFTECSISPNFVYKGAHHWSPISLVPHLIDPPSHWSPISLIPHLIGPPSHWSPISLVPQMAPMHHPFHWSPISLVPPTHRSPISLVPQLISPPLHYLNSLVPLLIGPPFISPPIFGQSQWSPISLATHLIGPPSHWSLLTGWSPNS